MFYQLQQSQEVDIFHGKTDSCTHAQRDDAQRYLCPEFNIFAGDICKYYFAEFVFLVPCVWRHEPTWAWLMEFKLSNSSGLVKIWNPLGWNVSLPLWLSPHQPRLLALGHGAGPDQLLLHQDGAELRVGRVQAAVQSVEKDHAHCADQASVSGAEQAAHPRCCLFICHLYSLVQ